MKFFEIRDRQTFIAVYAFRTRPVTPDNEAERYLLSRTGYGVADDSRCVMVGHLAGGQNAHCDSSYWCSRTMGNAHRYIEEHFDELESGAVIDVEFILGETSEPKVTERLSFPCL